jgi:hypothetical protein
MLSASLNRGAAAHPYAAMRCARKRRIPNCLLGGSVCVLRWESPPFEVALRGGELYGRGVDDDKGGLLQAVHVSGWVCAATTQGQDHAASQHSVAPPQPNSDTATCCMLDGETNSHAQLNASLLPI